MGFRWDEKRKKYVETGSRKRKNTSAWPATDYVKDAVKSYFQSEILNSDRALDQLAQALRNKEEREAAKQSVQGFIDEKVSKAKESKIKAKKMADNLKKAKKVIDSPLSTAISNAKKKAKAVYEAEETVGSLGSLGSYGIYAGAEIAESALNFATQSAQFSYNRYTTLQEDYITSQTVTNVMSTINRVKRAGSSVIGGIATGAATAGVVGAVIGGVSSAIDFGVNQYFEYQKRMSSYYQQLNATNYQTNFSASRAGLIGSSGTEN